MSKAKVGDKFVIEIADVIKGGETGNNQYRIKGFDKLFLDDKGLSFLESYDDADFAFRDGCVYGADIAWDFAHSIMEIPIHERAKMFNISKNTACFKDISEKFTLGEAMEKYNNRNINTDVQDKILDFIKENNISLAEFKKTIKYLMKKEAKDNHENLS